jgi:hypothetical protein
MFRYKLRTLLIVAAVAPPILAAGYFVVVFIWNESVASLALAFLFACFMAVAIAAKNVKRTVRRAFSLPLRPKDSD